MNTFNLKVKTTHYETKLTVIEDPSIHSVVLLMGDERKPSLLANIITPGSNAENDRMKEWCDDESKTAKLSNLESVYDCIHNDITQNYFDKHSFGIELLYALTFILTDKFPFVNKVRLNDTSYIPYNRDPVETIDLLIYSIALYGITWYEKMLHACIDNKEYFDNYNEKLDFYVSPAAKKALNFDSMAKKIIGGGSMFAKQQLSIHMEKWEHCFNISSTLPDFLQKIAKDIGQKNKCEFFKGWLEGFISSYIPIYREWVFDLPVDFSNIKGVEML